MYFCDECGGCGGWYLCELDECFVDVFVFGE